MKFLSGDVESLSKREEISPLRCGSLYLAGRLIRGDLPRLPDQCRLQVPSLRNLLNQIGSHDEEENMGR
jgi:hypothetical protein